MRIPVTRAAFVTKNAGLQLSAEVRGIIFSGGIGMHMQKFCNDYANVYGRRVGLLCFRVGINLHRALGGY